MKEIVYAVYHNINYEARSNELLQCIKQIGNVHIVTYSEPLNEKNIDVHLIKKDSVFALFSFLKEAKKTIKEVNPDIVVLHDNDCSVLIKYIKRRFPKTVIVYDSSELYISYNDKLLEERHTDNKFENGKLIWIKQKLTSFRRYYEKRDLKKCDIILAANIERANIMKKYFCLKCSPIVFDNMHRIDDEIDYSKCEEKFYKYISKDAFNIVFAGGISPERNTIKYVEAVKKLGETVNLIIVGSASQTELLKYKALKEEESLKHISYLGFISRAELKYLFQRCQASVIVFDKYTINTLYCASGKMYESLFEGTPILTSENPPLKRICEDNNVGVSNDDYYLGIQELMNNYDHYKSAVSCFIDKLNYEDRVKNLRDSIIQELEYLENGCLN